MNEDFKNLIAKKRKAVDANKEANMWGGFKNVLTEIYPDNTHFIFELLQNAEDTGANTVTFTLEDGALRFEHNGNRCFNFKDVESIVNIGDSTKREDKTSIGKFGVGFKAVFAYTDTPEIHSGEYHFRISDLVVPEDIGIGQVSPNDGLTRFDFPFNNANKPKEKAIQEITKGLLALGDNTLLFLTHITKIEYLLPDGTFGSLQRIDHEEGHTEIKAVHPDETQTASHWLRFTKCVDVKVDDGTNKQCQIAIAYHLETNDAKNKQTEWKIVPLGHGDVSIYFPAEKETSKLRFHIHAPFASTVARDSVRDCDENNQLRDHIAELVAESLEEIKNCGMLTVEFLATLPNPNDNLAAYYEPIRETIVQSFRTKPLTPTKNGTHAPANTLYKGLTKISEVIGDDLWRLVDDVEALWSANASQINQRDDLFLEALEMNPYSWEDFELTCDSIFSEENIEWVEHWILKKDDKWLMRFYALVGETIEKTRANFSKLDCRIIRVESEGESPKHVLGTDAYFAPEDGVKIPRDADFVKPSVYSKGRSDEHKKYARAFLEHIGVKPFDEKAVIERLLAKYDSSATRPKKPKKNDLLQFINYQKNFPNEVSIFRGKKILFSNDEYWDCAQNFYLDAPYVETGLADLSEIHGKRSIWDGYTEIPTKKQLPGFIEFLKALGAMSRLSIKGVSTNDNPNWRTLHVDFSRYGVRSTNTGVRHDYSIDQIEKYLDAISTSTSLLIWDALISADKEVARAQYRPNQQYPIREVDSQLVYHLKRAAWIPNKAGEFCKPEDMKQDELLAAFVHDDRNGLLTAIGFGENAKKSSEEYQSELQKAHDAGFDSVEELRELREIKRHPKYSLQGFREYLGKESQPELPEGSVPNPERRRKGIQERGENAPSIESVTRERSVQKGLSGDVAEAKAYLRTKYTNVSGQLMCQCCNKEMPFKINGEYYFEAVQCIKGLAKRHVENRLTLCPTCAAKYQYACDSNHDDIRTAIMSSNTPDDATSAEIEIKLAGRDEKLRFVGTHFFDLKIVLMSEV